MSWCTARVKTAVALGLQVKTTPAVAVVTPDAKVKKLFTGKIRARSLASVLRSVAPDKTLPKK